MSLTTITVMPRTTAQPSPADANLLRDAEALHAALSGLLRVYQFRDRDRICCYDISVTQCYALEELVEKGQSRSQTLAEALLLDKSTTTRVVDALVRKGYVKRRPDPDDARAVSLCATTEGRKLYHKINRELIQQQAELLHEFEPSLRNGATEVIRKLTRAAQARFISGASVGTCGPARGTDTTHRKCE